MFSPRVNKLLHFSIAEMSSSFEKKAHDVTSLSGISVKRLISTWQLWAELKDIWSAIYRSFSSIYGWPLYWIASIARSFLFLIQFISFQELHFLLVISLIFPSKNSHFIFLMVLLNFFQSLSHLECLYISKSLQQLSSHQALECLVILATLEYLCQILSMLLENVWTMVSRASMLWMVSILILLREQTSLLIKWDFSSLFLIKECLFVWMCYLMIEMLIVIGVWSEVSLQSG